MALHFLVLTTFLLFNGYNAQFPVIEDGPKVTMNPQGFPIINIGNDLCLGGTNMPPQLFINCCHNQNVSILGDPPPVASWTLNGGTLPDGTNIFVVDTARPDLNDQLQIFNNDTDSSINDIIGIFVCNLTNNFGSDTATSNIITTPDIDKSSGFVSEQDAMLLRIGEETCQSSGATSGVKIKCPIMSNLSNVVFERRWTKDGVLIDSSDETILTTGPGIYVCTFSNICGKVNVTSVINVPPPNILITGGFNPNPIGTINIGTDACLTGYLVLQCLVLGGTPPLTRVWTHDGVVLPVTIEYLLVTSGGSYTCSVSNDCPIPSIATSVISRVPVIDEGSGFVTDSLNAIDVGSDVCVDQSLEDDLTIQCNLLVGSTSSPLYMWSKDGDPSFSSNASSIMLDRSDVNIVGKYTCRVSTSVDGLCGMDEATSHVLLPPPNILITGGFNPNPIGTINIGTDACLTGYLVLQCLVLGGTPPLTRVWTHDGVVLPVTIEYLLVTSGVTYTCSVSNDCPIPSIATSVISRVPVIDEGSGFVTDSLNAIDVGSDVCVDQSLEDDLTIQCNLLVGSTSSPLYMWSKDGDPSFSSNASSIMLDRSDMNISGNYTCRVSTSVDGLCGMDATSHVLLPPNILMTGGFNSNPNGTINIGTDACLTGYLVLQCLVLGGTPPITRVWTHDGRLLTETNELLPVSSSGTYTCSVSNECPTPSIATSVITGVPVIDEGSGFVTDSLNAIDVGSDVCVDQSLEDDLTIQCNLLVGSTSSPLYMWSKDGDPSFSSNASSIMLDRSDMNISGNYTCRVSTSVDGLCGMDATSHVLLPPNILMTGGFNSNPNGTINIGTDACLTGYLVLQCLVLGGTPPITRVWTHDGRLLTETNELLPVSSSGTYTCSVSNECPTPSIATSVITGVPVIDEGSGFVTDSLNAIDVGSDVCVDQSLGGGLTIQCNLLVGSTSSPLYMWSKDGDPSFSSNASSIMLDQSDVNIVGNYTCRVSTSVDGLCGMDATSHVLSPPNILMTGGFNSNPNGTINIGTDACLTGYLVLQCLVLGGTPPITRVWTHDGRLLTETNEFLPVSSSGTYTCSVSNECPTPSIATSVITGVPVIDEGSGFVTDSLNAIDVGSDVCVDQSLRGDLTIQCNLLVGSMSSPLYTWSKDGDPSFSSNASSIMLDRSDMNIVGNYTCRVSTGFDGLCGMDEATSHVVTLCTPIISIPPPGPPTDRPPTLPPNMLINIGQNVCITTDQMVDINCATESGSVPINFIWTRDPDPAVISTMSVLQDVGVGTYNCKANNSVGSDVESSSIYSFPNLDLQVVITPRDRCDDLREQPSPNVDYCAFLFDTVTIICSSPDTHEGGVIIPNGETGRRDIVYIEESDSGTYTCSLDNACGYTTKSFYLAVFDPAVINRETPLPPDMPVERNFGAGRSDDPVTVAGNDTVRLHCPYSGINEPTTRWLLVASDRTTTEIVDMPPDIMLINDTVNRNLILVIDDFTEEFEGTYRCDTGNIAGDDEGDVVIRFETPEGEWSKTPWSSCDPDCYLGTRMRVVTCREVYTRILLPDSSCIEERPASMERCIDRGPCFLDPQWVAQEWSQCSHDCGGGYRIRNVVCQIPQTGEIVDDVMCDGQLRPHTFEYCNLDPCCSKDRYPQFCKLIRGSPLCENKVYKRDCCWSCR